MRLTRGTLVLIVAAIVVIVAVVLFNASPASAPPPPTATAGSSTAGPLFQGLDAASVAGLAVENPAAALAVAYHRGEDGTWSLDGDSTGYTLDGSKLDKDVSDLAGLASYDTFSSDSLADYGLDAPVAVLTLTNADGSSVKLVIGGTNPTGTRRYVVALTAGPEVTPEAEMTAEATAEAMPILSGAQSISTVVNSTIQSWLDLLTQPPYVPTAAPTPTSFLPTPESTAEATAEATAETTPEATETAGS
ncbi:MAG: DUF4340 domain-containing protein [Anaerolineae bacterium]